MFSACYSGPVCPRTTEAWMQMHFWVLISLLWLSRMHVTGSFRNSVIMSQQKVGLLPCQAAGLQGRIGCRWAFREVFIIKDMVVMNKLACNQKSCWSGKKNKKHFAAWNTVFREHYYYHGNLQKFTFRFQWRLSEQESMLLLSLYLACCCLFSNWS